MSDMQRLGAFSRTLLLLATLTAAPGFLHAQGRAVIPEHATAKTYGTGWDCERGYQRVGGGCAAIQLPANAYLTPTSYGRPWECRRGFRVAAQSCAAIEVPPNAYLESNGDRWKCDRGYRSVAGSCAALELPAHAYLDAAGERWLCDRGYRETSDSLHRDQCAGQRVPDERSLRIRLGLRSRLPRD